jgi:predicted lipoprotein DUF2279
MKKKIIIFFCFTLLIVNSYSGDNDFQFRLKEKSNVLLKNAIYIPLFNEKNKITLKNNIPLLKKESKVNPVKMAILGGMAAGVFTAMHIYYSNTWWKDSKHYFKFAQDGFYARNMDKASHIYTANVITEGVAMGFEWTGVKPMNALIYGAITSLAYETYIEINDGFAPNWGFDWVDMGSNLFGVMYPFLQRAVPAFQDINFKWSFKPDWISKKITKTDDLLDDYTNMAFWLSVNPELFFPKSVTKAKFYPNFLALALGLSVKNASHTIGSQNAYTEWFLALDIDVRKLPGKSDFLIKLKKLLNFYHFPMPTVRFSPSGIWYGLYF